MKNHTRGLLLIAFLFASRILTAQSTNQDIVWQDNTFEDWELQGGWEITTRRISTGPNWGQRRAFQTPSGEQALLFDSDALGSGDPIEQQVTRPFPHEADAVSPPLELGNDSLLYLEFMQYYRNFQSSTSVDLLIPGREDWISIPVNQEYGINAQTPDSAYTVRLDLSAYAGSLNGARMRFKFRGTRYFWMIDDVKIIRSPDRAISEAIQPSLTDKLEAAGKEYEVDYLGGVYHPRQLMVEWTKDTDANKRAAWKERNQVTSAQTCTCNPDVELLTFEPFVNLGEDNLIQNFSTSNGPPSDNNTPIWMEDNIPVEGGKTYYLTFRVKQEVLGTPFSLKASIEGATIKSFSIAATTAAKYHAIYTAPSTGNIKLALFQSSSTSTNYSIDYIYFGEGTVSSQNQTPASVQGITEDCPPDPTEIENWGRNYYDHVEDDEGNPTTTYPPLPTVNNSSKDGIIIAILDTGLDYASFDKYTADPNQFDNPNKNQCYQNDIMGWNMVGNNNQPYDDHCHGTHVTGIIYKTLAQFQNANCGDIRLLSVKTHDYRGIGTEFDNVCGIYYAQQAGADLINASWGYYGAVRTNDGVMYNAINKDPNLIFVTSSGNEKANLDTKPNYPGSFALDNIAVVGAVDKNQSVWANNDAGTNTSANQVEFLADGVNIESWIPSFVPSPNNNNQREKTGTSMAAPVATANLAILKAANPTNNASAIINELINLATPINGLGTNVVINPENTYINTTQNVSQITCCTGIWCYCAGDSLWKCIIALLVALILLLFIIRSLRSS